MCSVVGNGGLLPHQNQPQLRKCWNDQFESNVYTLKSVESLRGGGEFGKGPGSPEL